MDHLDRLENDSVFILREAYRKFDKLAMLWSMGKDSTVMLWLARKAFLGRVPYPVLHIDTTFKIPSMVEFRDRMAREMKLDLIVSKNEGALSRKRTFPDGGATRVECCTWLKKDALKKAVDERGFNGIIVGVRRDEEPTRAKERYFSPRDANMEWDVEDQPPEFWDQFKTDFKPGTHVRIHPLLHWTELDIWDYIAREKIPVISLYFSDANGERYRSIGCAQCTARIRSTARTPAEIAEELRKTNVPERAGRAQDKESEDAFEKLRRDGYM
ncbi:MAG TPA: sulfate adenylyltransferase [Elusimicrobia bacterium]|nr:sulfate adenylyltransferase [Elusimicrobiota bacterium]